MAWIHQATVSQLLRRTQNHVSFKGGGAIATISFPSNSIIKIPTYRGWSLGRRYATTLQITSSSRTFQNHQIRQGRWCRAPCCGFHTEADFHTTADDTLDSILDAVEALFEDEMGENDDMPEGNVASGVLTLSMGAHGTWVINKQAPNRQIWWSSPISGPRRYEYDGDKGVWVHTKYANANTDGKQFDDDEFRDSVTLSAALKAEIRQIYGLELDLEA